MAGKPEGTGNQLSTITERVAAGAAFLDQHDPEWWRADVEQAIDLDMLDLASTSHCVLGQRCPLDLRNAPYAPSPYDAMANSLSGLGEDDEPGPEVRDSRIGSIRPPCWYRLP